MKYPFRKEYRVTSPFGFRTVNGVSDFHAGIDLVCDQNWGIVSTDAGTVVASQIITDRSNPTWEWGNYVCIQTNDGKHVYYCHMQSRAVKYGDKVKVGTPIGIMGNTGYSFGAHLHYEVRVNNSPINAAQYLGIKNQIGKATPTDEGDDGMTPAEKKAFEALQKKVEEQETEIKTLKEAFEALCMDYDKHTFTRFVVKSDIPNEFLPDIEWLIDNGYLKGSKGGKLNLSYDMLRQLVIMSRFGQDVFDKMESNAK